ncbi:hypothetical protein GCM10017600_81540 [Streptosporangium carneum]|uniref:Uncharacterized protein n=1 Tax=Streptosporangium carneum TaxID=47481 RepID=A0A9W6MI06_9ACTN|nr:hypothetical protein GCM10017600_81540 [Streptosporangium carneum]
MKRLHVLAAGIMAGSQRWAPDSIALFGGWPGASSDCVGNDKNDRADWVVIGYCPSDMTKAPRRPPGAFKRTTGRRPPVTSPC